jgi:hypothetical protein
MGVGSRVALAALTVVACERAERPREAKVDEAKSIAPEPPEILAEKAAGLQGVHIEVRRAYFYPLDKAWFRPAPDDVLVAVEVVATQSGAGAFDPNDLEVIDVDTGQGLVRAQAVLPLTADGRLADPRDPVFADADKLRLIVVHAVTAGPRRVQLRHGGRDLGEPAPIEEGGPAFEPPSIEPLSHAAAGAAPLDGYQRHRVLLEMRNWTRMDDPSSSKLAYSLLGVEKIADPDKWLEVDDGLRPASGSLERMPTLVPRRRFVVEYWLREGGKVIGLDEVSRQIPLPSAPLSLPAATEKALAGAEPDLDASHYLEE